MTMVVYAGAARARPSAFRAAGLWSVLLAALLAFVSPMSAARADVPVDARSIEEVFQDVQERIDGVVADTQGKIALQRDRGVARVILLRDRGLATALVQRNADKLKRNLTAAQRVGVIRLNREQARAMFELRRHVDYEREFGSRLEQAIAQALADLRASVDQAAEALDDAVRPPSSE